MLRHQWHIDGESKQIICSNSRTQTAPAFEELLSARRNRAIHPIAGPTLLHSIKMDALYFKIPADEFIKIHATGENIPPHRAGNDSLQLQCAAQFIENLEGKKRD